MTQNRLVLAGIFLFLVIGSVIYSPSMNGAFQFDDHAFILGNPAIRSLDLSSIWGSYNDPTRFISHLSFALNYQAHQLDPFGYHIINWLIHILNTINVWSIIFLLFQTPCLKEHPLRKHALEIGFMAAMFFLVHPLQTQAVSYISQRFASLATMFYLFSLNMYICARIKERYNSLFLSFAILFCVMGMFTKQIVATLPIAVLFVETFFISQRKGGWGKRIAVSAPFLLIIPWIYRFDLSVIFRREIPSGSHDGDVLTPFTYLFTQVEVLVRYLQLWLVPIGQNLDHDFPVAAIFQPVWIFSFVVLLSLAGFMVGMYARNRLIFFGLFWFFLTLSVESTVIPLRHVIFEHRMYLPSMGIFLILSVCIFQWIKKPQVRRVVCLGLVVILSTLTFMRNHVWQSEIQMWEDVALKSPQKARPFINLGKAYGEQGEWQKALASLERALKLNPQSSIAYTNRGFIYRKLKIYDLAISDLTRAIKLRPGNYRAYNQRGLVHVQLGHRQEALADFNQSLQEKPGYASAVHNRNAALQWIGKKHHE